MNKSNEINRGYFPEDFAKLFKSYNFVVLMNKLPKRMEIYCDRIGRNVNCTLTRGGLHELPEPSAAGNVVLDYYVCPRRGTSKEPPCNPCSHYALGVFIPVPPSVTRRDGSLDMAKWFDLINAVQEVPLSRPFKST